MNLDINNNFENLIVEFTVHCYDTKLQGNDNFDHVENY